MKSGLLAARIGHRKPLDHLEYDQCLADNLIRCNHHFQKLAKSLPAGLERDLCGELAAEEEEHVALLEGELEQLG